jgi:hypothetical protein
MRPQMGGSETTTTYENRAADTNVFASTAQAEGNAEGAARSAGPSPGWLARAYEGFLEMPVLVILALMWVAGAALLGSCALALYVVGSVLLRAVVGYS